MVRSTLSILHFWGPYAERGGGGGVWLRWKNGCNAFVCVSLRLESRSRKALISSVRFQLILFSRARDCTIFTLHNLTDFYVERVTAHHIKRNYYSCFHHFWPNSKTKLKLKHLWEQGGPLVFRRPYATAYREDRHCRSKCLNHFWSQFFLVLVHCMKNFWV